jgi:hypothetical protein
MGELEEYRKLLRNDKLIEESDDFKKVLKSLKGLTEGKKWNKLSASLLKIFLKNKVSKHYAVKIFFMNENPSVKCPIELNKAYEDIQSLDAPGECEEIR